ncbi:hypothetical protein [Curtobacterium sp. NPDC088465]|uniref:hypothetical protein n=1 Tax=Curtobacterium sp. NPDC088465 TaxID=3363967 RepID=UPI0037F9B901
MKVKHHDSIDVICAVVTASHERPRELNVGLPPDEGLRIVGRVGPLTAATKDLAEHLQEPT